MENIYDMVGGEYLLHELTDAFPESVNAKINIVFSRTLGGKNYYRVKFMDESTEVNVTNTELDVNVTNTKLDVEVNNSYIDVKQVVDIGQLVVSGQLTAPQTNTIVIPAPGVGKRLGIIYSSLRNLEVNNVAGQTWYADNTGKRYGMYTFERQVALASPVFNQIVLLPVNSPYLINITGNDNCFYFVEYVILDV